MDKLNNPSQANDYAQSMEHIAVHVNAALARLNEKPMDGDHRNEVVNDLLFSAIASVVVADAVCLATRDSDPTVPPYDPDEIISKVVALSAYIRAKQPIQTERLQ